jgi:response regulator RpfG family c-di-GMP phosphodiesterase
MRKLLYVEDNEDNLYMLQLRFDVLGGYEVLSARDGAAGVAMAASERPDLILSLSTAVRVGPSSAIRHAAVYTTRTWT